jgi:Zn-dependent protease
MLSEDSVRNFGVRLGRLFGINIWVHWLLIFLVALQLLQILLAPPAEGLEKDYKLVLTNFAAFAVALLLSVLLHELGHAYAAYRQGGHTQRIVLWPLGGLAYCEAPQAPGPQFWVTAGGPLVTLGVGAAATGLCAALGWAMFPFGDLDGDWSFHRLLFQDLSLWNWALLLVNVLPCYPLDGGRMLHTWLWDRMGTHHGALLVTLNVSRVTASAALVGALGLFILGFGNRTWPYEHPFLDTLDLLLVLGAISYFFAGRQVRMQLRYGELDEGGPFGYDFSRGYTSLERSAPRDRRPSWRERRRAEKERRERERRLHEDEELRRRLDDLLAKIHDQGMDSLTREEQIFLERASKHLRESEARRD